MSDPLYLLDTNVLLLLMRGQDLGRHIDQRFRLSQLRQRALVCIVSHGEIRVLAHHNRWGRKRHDELQTMLDNLVPVQLDHTGVIDAYVDLDLYSRRYPPQGARTMGKNDLWIAAAARASGATLLTTDHDFEHLIPGEISGVVIPVETPADAR